MPLPYRRLGEPSLWPPEIADLERAMNGEPTALETVMAAAHPRLVAFAMVVGVPPDEVPVAVEKVIRDVVTSFDRLPDPLSFRGWFWREARKIVRPFTKRRRTPENHTIRRPRWASTINDFPEVHGALAMLRVKDRELLYLREVEGLDLDEINSGFLRASTRNGCELAVRRLDQAIRSAR